MNEENEAGRMFCIFLKFVCILGSTNQDLATGCDPMTFHESRQVCDFFFFFLHICITLEEMHCCVTETVLSTLVLADT